MHRGPVLLEQVLDMSEQHMAKAFRGVQRNFLDHDVGFGKRDAPDSRIISYYQNNTTDNFYPESNSPQSNPIYQQPPIAAGTKCPSTLNDGIPDAWRALYHVTASANTVDPNLGNFYTYFDAYTQGVVP